ncbi:phosphorothioated DNA-binding restriction endonuclease [Rubrivirga marina]|uniref:Uncharacterized protein n=1 Tax=Rubrivirga marina TaxID=1196024 RepID=A0A271IYS1_9BACT|nr:HNH endonuclease [Rubrivirga marina]PAP75845.1 hypothetical protein BSZ37_05000 [Rubrivirga marina]
MTRAQVLDRFDGIARGRTSGGRRAPHKPLLLLYALARFADGETRLGYRKVEARVRELLRDFGPAGSSTRIHYPFWRLQKDGLWTVGGADALTENASGDVSVVALRKLDPVGRFTDEVADALRSHPGLAGELIDRLLADEFTEAYDDEILTAIGFDPDARETAPKRRRDPAFRRRVLAAYEYRCAVCGFSAHVGDAPVGLDAAHVKWHQYGGPDEVRNGLALCALHHRLLDRGAFTVAASSARERVVAVSEAARGNEGFERWMLAYHGRPLAAPVRSEYRVAEPMTAWHAREVFKGRPRS